MMLQIVEVHARRSCSRLPHADAAAAMIVAHCVSRWPSLPILMSCEYIEDDEHAKAGMVGGLEL